jgi:hypothetical protein
MLVWLSIASGLVVLIRSVQHEKLLRGLTVHTSWLWSIVASIGVVVAAVSSLPSVGVSLPYRGALQYLTVVLMLSPPICTLGARKPGSRAWQFFVILPMIVVLMWPVTGQLLASRGREAVILGAPATVGILFVLLMSAGTGIGTSMSLPVGLSLLAALCSLAPSAGWVSAESTLSLWTPILLVAAQALTIRTIRFRQQQITEAGSVPSRTTAVWYLFQDLYGLLWATRVMERVNQFAPRENWNVTLTIDGFQRRDQMPVEAGDLAQPIASFGWVLRRFADEHWLNNVFPKSDQI